jgi:hypothetical protein
MSMTWLVIGIVVGFTLGVLAVDFAGRDDE